MPPCSLADLQRLGEVEEGCTALVVSQLLLTMAGLERYGYLHK